MKTHITKQDLKEWDACYTPEQIEALPESATIAEVLRMPNVPIWDRLWAVYREEVLTESELEEATHELLTEVFEERDFYYAIASCRNLKQGSDCGPEHAEDAQDDELGHALGARGDHLGPGNMMHHEADAEALTEADLRYMNSN